jgi:hypothetical protein
MVIILNFIANEVDYDYVSLVLFYFNLYYVQLEVMRGNIHHFFYEYSFVIF